MRWWSAAFLVVIYLFVRRFRNRWAYRAHSIQSVYENKIRVAVESVAVGFFVMSILLLFSIFLPNISVRPWLSSTFLASDVKVEKSVKSISDFEENIPRNIKFAALLERLKQQLPLKRVLFKPLGAIPYNRPTPFVMSISDDPEKARLAVFDRYVHYILGKPFSYVAASKPAPISYKVTATLSADDDREVEIKLLGQADAGSAATQTQFVVGPEPTVWQWSVTPKTSDPINLHLTYQNVVEIDGKEITLPGNTFTDPVKVDATIADRIAIFTRDNGPILITIGTIAGSIATGVGIFWGWVRFWKKKKNDGNSENQRRFFYQKPSRLLRPPNQTAKKLQLGETDINLKKERDGH